MKATNERIDWRVLMESPKPNTLQVTDEEFDAVMQIFNSDLDDIDKARRICAMCQIKIDDVAFRMTEVIVVPTVTERFKKGTA